MDDGYSFEDEEGFQKVFVKGRMLMPALTKEQFLSWLEDSMELFSAEEQPVLC